MMKGKEFLEDRAYYTKIPRHVLFLPDGGRRYAHREKISDNQVYDLVQQKCQDLLNVGFNEFGLETISIFVLRPESFEAQRRTDENLRSIFIAGNKLANAILNGETGVDPDLVYLDTITLAGEEWMKKPTRVRQSQGLSELWDSLEGVLARAKEKERKGKTINLLINYSGRREIEVALETKCLQLTEPVGVSIRTGDGMRSSDCPLYALSQAHFCLIPKFLPEVTQDDFREVLRRYY